MYENLPSNEITIESPEDIIWNHHVPTDFYQQS